MAIDVRFGSSGNADGAEGDQNNATRDNVIPFTAVTTAGETAMQVRAAVVEGYIGTPHAEDLFMRVRSCRVNQVTPIYFEGEISYDALGPNQNDRPENQHAQISSVIEKVDEPVDEDANGNPLQNKAGEPFDPPLTRRYSDRVFTIRKNVEEFNAEFFDQYNDVVNSDEFLGYKPGQCLMDGISGTLVWQDDYEYWEIEAVVRVRRPPAGRHPKKTWFWRVRHEGYYVLAPDANNVLKAVRRLSPLDGQPCSVPLPLKDDGTAEDDPTVGHFLEFKRYETMDFGALNLI